MSLSTAAGRQVFFTNLLTAIVLTMANLLVFWFECQPPDVLLTNQVG